MSLLTTAVGKSPLDIGRYKDSLPALAAKRKAQQAQALPLISCGLQHVVSSLHASVSPPYRAAVKTKKINSQGQSAPSRPTASAHYTILT